MIFKLTLCYQASQIVVDVVVKTTSNECWYQGCCVLLKGFSVAEVVVGVLKLKVHHYLNVALLHACVKCCIVLC